MEYVSVYFGSFNLPVGFVPAAYEVNADMERACHDEEDEKILIGNASFDAVENILGQIYKKEHIKDLFDGVFEYGKNKKQFVGFPYLF